MKIFITGASGFVGGAIAKSLKGKHQILALARSRSAAEKIESLGIAPVLSDLNSITSEHLKGSDVVIHCAAYAEEWGAYEQFYQANVEGTQQLLKASQEAGVKRFLFIGTEAALFHGQDMIDIDETYPYSLRSPYPYSKTKALAEDLVLKTNSEKFQTLSLRPRMVWGPNDQSILPALLYMVKRKQFSWVGNGQYRTSTTHIVNLVHAVELALSNGKGGEAYFIANKEVVLMKDFLTNYLRTQGIEVEAKSIPTGVARFAARLSEFFWKTLRLKNKPPLVRFTIDIMSAHCTVKTDKARSELGYQPLLSTEEGLKTMPRLFYP